MQKEEKTKKQEYYTVSVEAKVPLVLKFKILAYSPEEALDRIQKEQPISKDIFWNKMLKTKASVYKLGTSLILTVKNFI